MKSLSKKSMIVLLLSLTTVITHAQTEERYARVIAFNGDVSINGVAVKPGQELVDKNADIEIGKDSYITLLSNEGDVKTFTKGRLKVQYLPSSMRPAKPRLLATGAVHVCGPRTEWLMIDSHAPKVVGDTLLMKWKTDLKPPFEFIVESMFGDLLHSGVTTDQYSIVFNADSIFKGENAISLILKSKNETAMVVLRRPNDQDQARLKRELTAITGSAAEQKAWRICILKGNDFLLDHYREALLMSDADLATLPADLKLFAEKTRNAKFSELR